MYTDERNARIDLYDSLDLDGLLALERGASSDVDLLVFIGQHFLELGQFDRCHAYYKRALALDPDDGWTHLYMGNLCYAISCYDESEKHFKRAIELLPRVACPHWCLADIYEKQGYWSRTEHHYRRAIEIDPLDETARRRLEAWLAENRSCTENQSPLPESDRTLQGLDSAAKAGRDLRPGSE